MCTEKVRSSERLQQSWNTWDNPYGEEGDAFAVQLRNVLTEKMDADKKQRLVVLSQEVKLTIAHGIVLCDESTAAASLIIRDAIQYGIEEVAQLLRWSISEIHTPAPKQLIKDLQEIGEWIEQKQAS